MLRISFAAKKCAIIDRFTFLQVKKTFPDFEANKQVGPLLEWVASLRVCVGYPDAILVREAEYLIENRRFLRPDVRCYYAQWIFMQFPVFRARKLSSPQFLKPRPVIQFHFKTIS